MEKNPFRRSEPKIRRTDTLKIKICRQKQVGIETKKLFSGIQTIAPGFCLGPHPFGLLRDPTGCRDPPQKSG